MMADAGTGLDKAIERAHELNEQAGAVLEKALNAARRNMNPFVEDYRFKYAMQMLVAHTRPNNVAAQYFLAHVKKRKSKADK